MMYTFDSRVRYSEIDETGKLSIRSIIDYMQDCSNFQAEDLGAGIAWLKENALMWVLASWQIIFERFPSMGEKITIGTQVYGFEKMLGYRNFVINDEKGERLVIANSTWVLMDLNKNRPGIVTEEIGSVYGKAEPLPMEYAPRKIRVTGAGSEKERFQVREYHLDTNHHVNNGQYVQMAMEFIEKRAVVKELRAEYKSQAKYGDEIVPVVYEPGEEETIVSLNGADGRAYAVVQFFYSRGDKERMR